MPEYTVAAVVAVLAALAAERWWLRSGLLRCAHWWLSLGICLVFMVLVNGWLTKLSAPIVLYGPEAKTPWRFPWDIPVEDYLFGFALLTLVAARWEAAARRPPAPSPPSTVGHQLVPPMPRSVAGSQTVASRNAVSGPDSTSPAS